MDSSLAISTVIIDNPVFLFIMKMQLNVDYMSIFLASKACVVMNSFLGST